MSVRTMNGLAVLFTALAAMILVGAALSWVAQRPYFALRAIEVRGELQHVTSASVRSAIAGRLRPGGWLVFDLHTDATLAFARANPVITGEQDGAAFALTTGIDEAARTIVTTIDLVAADPEDSFVEHHRQVIHSDATVREALGAAGFAVVAVLDEYTPTPATHDTLRATWVARLRPSS